MEESEDNMSTEDVRSLDSPLSVKNKPKKRSLVERELETNLTARVTSPVTGEGTSTSRYGRARRLKTKNDLEAEKVMKPLRIDTKTQPQAYKMHASNSPIRKESPKRAVSVASSIENQIENIYNENMSLSRFGLTEEAKSQSPAKKFTKIYIRKDLIQKPDTDTVTIIKNMFSPAKNSTHLNNILERSSEKYSLNGHGKSRNGFPDTSSVVKTLDFDGKKKKKETKDKTVAKNELFELEASSDYQVGDLAWARVGTYPFWPCIVTREPFTDKFVKKKLFGRVEHDVLHVTFFGDNGRRGWIVDNMLRKFLGRPEFEGARDKFTPEAKKKDPRFYAAHFVSEKKLPLWNVSVNEAETLMREPKRLRIDILYDMLEKARASKTTPKREKSGKITRTDSDVSLSESLYDTLFSEDDGKADEGKRTKKSRNKSLDVSDVVTACLDNMAAKSGIIKIQKQSHMDRWLQKAKSKTPEKTQPKIRVRTERETRKDRAKKKPREAGQPKLAKNKSLSSEKNLLPYQNEHDYSSVNYENHDINDSSNIKTDFEESGIDGMVDSNGIGVIAKVESLCNNEEDCSQDDIITTIVNDDFVMNDLENADKVEICDVDVIPETTKESVQNSNVCNVENCVSSNENKQIESKVELPLKSNVLSNYGIQTRRSKRKRQSDIEKNHYIVNHNETKEIKLQSVPTIAKTDIETTLSDRNIVNSNNDHTDNLLDRDKKDAMEPNTEIKEEGAIVSEDCKDTSMQNEDDSLAFNGPKSVVTIEPAVSEVVKDTNQTKEHNECNLLPLNAPKAAVAIDPAVSEIDEDTPKQAKRCNKSDLLPLNGPKAVIAINPTASEVVTDTSEQNKDLLPLNSQKALVAIDSAASKVVKDSSDQNEDLLPLNVPKAVVGIDSAASEENKDSSEQNEDLLPLNGPKTVVANDPTASEVVTDTSEQNKNLLPLNSSKALVAIDSAASEVVKDSSEQNEEFNQSALLPLNDPKSVVVIDPAVIEVVKNTSEPMKEYNQSDLLPLNVPTSVVVIEEAVTDVDKDTSKQNKRRNKSDLLLLNSPKAVVAIDPAASEVAKDTTKQNKEPEHNTTDSLAVNDPKTVVVIEPAASEVIEDTSKQNKEHNKSNLLPLNGPKIVIAIDPAISETETVKDRSKQNKRRNKSAKRPLNGPKRVVVIDPTASEIVEDTSKINKKQCDLLLLNGPRAVVVIEPLKMEALEYRVIAKKAKQKMKKANLCNINKGDVNMKEAKLQIPKVDGIVVSKNTSVVKNVDESVLQNKIDPILETDSVEPAVKNVQDKNLNTEDMDKVNKPNEILPIIIKTETAPNDDTMMPTNKKDQNENVQIESIVAKNADSYLPPSNLKRSDDAVEPPKTATNVVIGEEMYVFDRTLSQDYDEIDPDICDEANNLAIGPSNEEVIEKDSNYELKDVSKYERTLSPDYDEVNKETDETKTGITGAKGEDNLIKDDKSRESEREIDTEIGNDGAESKSQFFCKVSVHKSKEKIENEGLKHDTVPSQVTSNEGIPTLNGDENSIPDETIDENNKKTDAQEGKETSNAEQIHKKKNRKSPKLSLNKLKSEVTNENLNDVQNDNTEYPKSIFLDKTPEQNKVVSNINLKDNTNVTNSDTCNALDFEMLIDMEACKPRTPKINGYIASKESSLERKLREEFDADTASMKSEDSGVSITRRKIRSKEKQDVKKAMDDPEFLKYLELRQDALIDEHPELTQDEIFTYLYQTWLYEESRKSDRKKTDDVEQSNLVKGLNQEQPPQPKKIKKKPKVEKETNADIRDLMPKEKPKRKATQSKPYYNEEFSDLEEEDLETFSIFDKDVIAQNEDGEEIDEVELYFEKLTKPKPNVFKGFVREKVCEVCETTGNLVKCKSCHGTFHVDCGKNEEQIIEVPAPTRGRKKKKKPRGRKPKGYDESLMDSGSQSDEKSQDANISEELNISIEDEQESHITVDAAAFEAQMELKMKELQLEQVDFQSDQEIYWDTPPGQCEIVDVKHMEKPIDYSDYKCINCEKYNTPVCFVCKSNKSPKALIEVRQKCQVAHCHRYYHLECLECWPQTQFNSWEPSKTNKKIIEYIEALSCPRHVCHTCVSDDPRGCKTRFCGDKLARCVKCPATYHSFTKCLPAGTQILTGSQIICPRHYEQRAGKVPCHVNTGWCFICALGGTLICCEYCPTSFHAECLNIKPPEGNYMCEDCETGRLPLYGEMVWVKLGHYRWWPGIVLHPTEIPDNIMAVKHSPGEFVVRFFGQYDHYWVNRGRVFPFQEGDSGKISSQKSKIDAAFTTAMEHAQRACEILKNVEPNEEEEEDIASSLLPPHYVKLKVNKPVGSLTARRDIDANSLTQCDCDPKQPDPCGPYSHCLNRMLLTECGPLCRAGERCNNRAFERRDYPRLAAYRTPQRGWGLRTLEDIKQGQFVIEYVGELIDEEEFRRRMCRKHEIRDENFYFLTLDKERMIDAGPKGNLARFMNHCCEPNCETQKWTVLGDVRVGLFALRDIPANSEVTFNYNLECAGIEKKRCLCGAKRCSGYIGAKPKQEEAQPKKLKGPGKRTYKKRKRVDDSPSTSKTKPPIKIKIIKTVKPRELTEIEKDLLIIKIATNGMSSDSDSTSRLSVDERKDPKALKRKRVSFSSEEVFSSSVKKIKICDGEVD